MNEELCPEFWLLKSGPKSANLMSGAMTMGGICDGCGEAESVDDGVFQSLRADCMLEFANEPRRSRGRGRGFALFFRSGASLLRADEPPSLCSREVGRRCLRCF